MPKYFFNVHDGRNISDDTGTDLPDIYTAQKEAIQLSAALLKEMGAQFWNDTLWTLEVSDENGRVLFVLKFSAEEYGLDTDDQAETL